MYVDKELIDELKNNDMFAFERLIRIMQQPIFAYCYRMLGNMHEAEDITQEVFIKVYEKANTYKKEISFSAWVYRIAHNQCINQIRRKKILNLIPLHGIEEQILDLGSFDDILGYELSEELNEALSILSPENRSILILKVVYDSSYDEIAAILGKNEVLIRKRYERTRKKLEAHFKKGKEIICNEKASII